MRIRTRKIMRPLLVMLALTLLLMLVPRAHADPLVWQTPLGQIGLPFSATEILPIGYDIKYNQGISGASLPIWSLPKNAAQLQVGAVGSWPTQAANVQPYIAFGHDFARDIPVLSQYQSAHLNFFGRWASDRGDRIPIGYGVSASYSVGSPAGPSSTAGLLHHPILASRLNLYQKTTL